MRDAGLAVFTFDGVKENPTERRGRGRGRVRPATTASTCIVAVGGGSSMDCAKGINFLLTNGGRMADYKGFGKATKPMLPSVGVPTTAGHRQRGPELRPDHRRVDAPEDGLRRQARRRSASPSSTRR